MEGIGILNEVEDKLLELEQKLELIKEDPNMESASPIEKQKMYLALAYTLVTLRQAQLAAKGEGYLPPQLEKSLQRIQLLLKRV